MIEVEKQEYEKMLAVIEVARKTCNRRILNKVLIASMAVQVDKLDKTIQELDKIKNAD